MARVPRRGTGVPPIARPDADRPLPERPDADRPIPPIDRPLPERPVADRPIPPIDRPVERPIDRPDADRPIPPIDRPLPDRPVADRPIPPIDAPIEPAPDADTPPRRRPSRTPAVDVRVPTPARLAIPIVRGALAPGALGRAFSVTTAKLREALPHGLVVAAGLDPLTTPQVPPPILWSDGTNRLLVDLARTQLQCGDGFADVTLAVRCDETGDAQVVCTFVTSLPAEAGGFVWASEDRPRGPAIIVTLWGDALLALAWRALVETVGALTAATGRDTFDRAHVPATVVATRRGVTVLPMAPHVFPRSGDRQ